MKWLTNFTRPTHPLFQPVTAKQEQIALSNTKIICDTDA
jgi:hypothetical protein